MDESVDLCIALESCIIAIVTVEAHKSGITHCLLCSPSVELSVLYEAVGNKIDNKREE